MLTKKAINNKIANLESKLKPLYKQIDQICSKMGKQKQAVRESRVRSRKTRSRGRPPKVGMHKLDELTQKLENQTHKMETEAEKTLRNLDKQIKDLNAEIEQKKMLLERI